METSLKELKAFDYSHYELKRIAGKLITLDHETVFNASELTNGRQTVRDLTYFLFYRKESQKLVEFARYCASLNPYSKKAVYYAGLTQRAIGFGNQASAAACYSATAYSQATKNNLEAKKLGLAKLKELLLN